MAEQPMPRTTATDVGGDSRLRFWLETVLLILAPLALYAPSLRYGLLGMDDGLYYLSNSALHGGGWPGPVDVWRSYFSNEYFPVTATTLWLDLALFGPDVGCGARVHHLLWFAAGALAIRALVKRLTGRPRWALVVALLWAVHPVSAESALWLGQRKNLVAFALAFWSLERYVAARQAEDPQQGLRRLVVAWVLAVLALFGKTQAVAVPVLILAYELTLGHGRAARRALWLSPFVAAAGVFAFFNVFIMRRDLDYPCLGGGHLGAIATTGPILARYMWHTVFPLELSFYYGVEELAASYPLGWLAWALAAAVFAATTWTARRKTWVACGWALGLAGLSPALNVVSQLLPMTDHYQVWALPGWLLALSVIVADFWRGTRRGNRWVTRGRTVTALAAVLVFSWISAGRIPEFANRLALFGKNTQREPQSAWAWSGYAMALLGSQHPDRSARAGHAAWRALHCPDSRRLLSQDRSQAIVAAALDLHRRGRTEEAWELTLSESARIPDVYGGELTRAEVAARTGRAAAAVAWLTPHVQVEKGYIEVLRRACRDGARLPDELPPVHRVAPDERDEFQAQAVHDNLRRTLMVLTYATLQTAGPEEAFNYGALLVNMYPKDQGGRIMLAVVYRKLGLEQAARALLRGAPPAEDELWRGPAQGERK